MELEEFVSAAKAERDAMAAAYTAANAGTAVSEHLLNAQLSSEQRTAVTAAIDQALSDVFFTLLAALDGAASLGGTQQAYKLIGEDGTTISGGDGRLEVAAFAAFHQSTTSHP